MRRNIWKQTSKLDSKIINYTSLVKIKIFARCRRLSSVLQLHWYVLIKSDIRARNPVVNGNW
jgi:hypothetical protein